ncbi:hypothetical protein GCM10007874_51070 [Labrys miyagiensis]|uniref:Uncharacterized protein n=1 Tax=Labrys miyagiensis TaxID=346912 RepID=A0ABQ6CSY3_9HYPH|nr:hypothetical protein [Labrys miyagiensis]GLS22090.1 hypothetical protein GCM10007874_51070 [Labrys miyagiensis]
MQMRDDHTRRHLNVDEKQALKAEAIHRFLQQYARKAQKGTEPNDRKYSRDVERKVRQMKPQEFDSFLRYGEEE